MTIAAVEKIRREVVECGALEHPISNAARDLDCLFDDFECALQHDDRKSLLRSIAMLHHGIASLRDEETAERLCDKLQKLIPLSIRNTAPVLSNQMIFFVWIGTIGESALKTIGVWKRANPHYHVELWFDSTCLLAGQYMRLVRERAPLGLETDDDVIRFQNEVHSAVVTSAAHGKSFDDTLIDIMSRAGHGRLARMLDDERTRSQALYAEISSLLDLRDVNDAPADMMDAEFRRYYLREVALRANLAAASDILRLHLLHRFGGIYVDCDTLPALDHAFPRTTTYCREHGISFGFIDVLKAELYLRGVAPLISLPASSHLASDHLATRDDDILDITGFLRREFAGLVDIIEQDAAALTEANAFSPLPEIRLCENNLLWSGDPHHKNCFNNNIVIANPRSKAIRIVLREMRSRYRYLQRMNAVDISSRQEVPEEDSYRGRLLNYRYDALDDKPNVTVILSGPGLIFEVVTGLAYSILKLDDEVPPSSVAYALYAPAIGVSFMDQTFYTYDHSRSSWMKGADGALLI